VVEKKHDEGSETPDPGDEFARRIARKQRRKIRARKQSRPGAWFGLGMFGLVGWAVAVPLLAGIALGYWIDRTWSSGYSWTLMLMIGGLFLGVLNAWQWVSRERSLIERELEEGGSDE